MDLWQHYMEYDFTERLLYGLAVGFTLWFALALLLKVKKKHWFRDWPESGFTAVWLALAIRILLAEAYSIPSESMVPTLLISDHLLVSKTTYGWHVPFTKGRILRFRDVKRGEIVIFVPPHAPKQSYVKRCVGLPGDRVEVRAKQVYINGQPAEVPFSYGVLSSVAPESLPALKDEVQAYVAGRLPKVQALQAKGLEAQAQREASRTEWLGPFQLPKGTYYIEAAAAFQRPYGRLLDQPAAGELMLSPKDARMPKTTPASTQPNWTADHDLGNRDYFGPYVLKPGEYWMMGDNRDNSLDSRFFGPVSEDDLRGTPLVRYWPWGRMGLVR